MRFEGILLRTAALALSALCLDAAGDEPGPSHAPGAGVKPLGVVKIDIAETLDGKESRENLAAYFIRKKLREVGFLAWSTRPIRADDLDRRRREKEAAETKTVTAAPVPEAATEEERPAPDLVVVGTLEVTLLRTSPFYGQDVAFIFGSKAKLAIHDAAGKEVATIVDGEEVGQRTRDGARNTALKRMALFLAAGVMKSDPIRSRLTDKGKEAAERFVREVEAKREEKR